MSEESKPKIENLEHPEPGEVLTAEQLEQVRGGATTTTPPPVKDPTTGKVVKR
jgi:hypothetical protein